MPIASLLAELRSFMRVRKKGWLRPLVLIVPGVGPLVAFAQGTALAPFICTVF